MSTNISKKKRDDLLDKIKQIRAFIAAAPQDENTGNLLSYLSELEKDVNGKTVRSMALCLRSIGRKSMRCWIPIRQY